MRWGKSVSHALSFEFLAPVVSRFCHKMKGSGLLPCFFLAVFYLFWTPSAGLKTLHLGSCVVTTDLQEMQNGFSEIRDSVVCGGGNSQFCSCFSPSLLIFLCLSATWSQKEAGWWLLTRRMHSQETSVVHDIKVFWKGTLLTGSGHGGDERSSCRSPWQPSMTCHFLPCLLLFSKPKMKSWISESWGRLSLCKTRRYVLDS